MVAFYAADSKQTVCNYTINNKLQKRDKNKNTHQ